jgi:ferric-dicitrate binding protein FerR (iron transport regulator)
LKKKKIDPNEFDRIWNEMPDHGELDPMQKNRIWQNIDHKTGRPKQRSLYWFAASIAIVLLGTATFSWLKYNNQAGYLEVATHASSKIIRLKDSTEIILGQYSKLKYPAAFGSSDRAVFLEGNATFKVKHNGQSFTVNSGGVKTKVLGTFFKVTLLPGNMEAKVALFEGKVQVSYQEGDPTILKPGDEWWYTMKTKQLKMSHNESIQRKNLKLDFKNTDLSEVLQQLSMMYGVKISTAKSVKEGLKITGTLYYSSARESLEGMGFPFGLVVNTINKDSYEIE